MNKPSSRQIKRFAQAGLSAKGIVYCLLGVLAFMAAFRIGGASGEDADKTGVFGAIYKQTGGQILLAIVAAGLVCYTIWRGIQAFSDTEGKGKDMKGLAVRGRYLFSGLFYASVAFSAVRMLLGNGKGSGDSQQSFAQELLSKPAGQWMAGIVAAVLLGNGIYQVYYGLSEKYRKHVDKAGGQGTKALLTAGKIGYVARGVVWTLLAWLFFKAALHANAAEAGDTSKAFSFLQHAAYGPYLLGGVAIGLICYGVFNFVRARYEDFG
jgi:hypothetical protein